MKVLTRKKLLEPQTLKIELLDFGDDTGVYIREMTGTEKDLLEESLRIKVENPDGTISYKQNTERYRAKLAVQTVCDVTGKKIFKSGDVASLSDNIGAKRLEMITDLAQRLNAISEKDKESLVKNSEAGQSGDSTSDSALN